jgi:hypothetical protein
VELVTTTYRTGVKLTAEAMDLVEAQIKRLPLLGKWFVDIVPPPPSRHWFRLMSYAHEHNISGRYGCRE